MSNISFDDIGAVTATFFSKDGVIPGQVVKVTENGQVGPCSAGEPFCGLALSVRRGFSAVQVRGFMTLTTSGTVALGPVKLAADGNGGVKTADTGTEALVVHTDSAAHTAIICL